MTWLYFSMVMKSLTFTLPNSAARPTSLRARSTSMRCSARSFGIGEQLGGVGVVLGVVCAAAAGAGDGADVDAAIDRADVDFRRTADERESPANFRQNM